MGRWRMQSGGSYLLGHRSKHQDGHHRDVVQEDMVAVEEAIGLEVAKEVAAGMAKVAVGKADGSNRWGKCLAALTMKDVAAVVRWTI